MTRRTIGLTIALILLPSLAFAQNRPLKLDLKTATSSLGKAQRPAARGDNPYETPAIILMAAGGGLVLFSMLDQGVSCSSSVTTFNCGSHANKGLLFAGLGSAGAGVFLFMKGEAQRNHPMIAPLPRGFILSHRIKF